MGNTETSLKLEDLQIDKSKEQVFEDWNVSHGKLRDSPVIAFSAIHPPSSRKRPFMEKALQASKVYRHPGILRYLDGGVLGNEIIILCEEATPLPIHGLENMSLLQIAAGLNSVIETLVFLHEKAGVSHNNVCASSIYVTSDGVWKLWGLEYLCSFGDLTRDYIERINQYCHKNSTPPDDKSRISPSYQHARDCYFFGKLIEDTIVPAIKNGDQIKDVLMVDDFLKLIREKALHADSTQRPPLLTFSEHSLFQHEFLKVRNDIANILLLPVEQRDHFLKSLPSTLRGYSDEVVASTLGSLLLSHSFLLIPSSAVHLMPYLLSPRTGTNDTGLFSPPVFRSYIVPLLLQLFSIHDAAIRKVLLAHFDRYASLIPLDRLNNEVLPQILLGIRDTDEELIANTLRSLACLVPLLGADAVIGRNREQIFATAKPKTKFMVNRTNTLKKSKRATEQSAFLTLKATVPEVNLRVGQREPEVSTVDLELPSRSSPTIPERSSPDGGEMIEEDSYAGNRKTSHLDGSCSFENPSEDQWSDWEEMLDQPPPDIVGVLEVKMTEGEGEEFEDFRREAKTPPLIIKSSYHDSKTSDTTTYSRDSLESPQLKSSAMQLRTKLAPKSKKSQGLGEEYDIMSLTIKKKPDAERDLFADLAPNLLSTDFNLERMLIEASHKSKERLPSVSGTLAELDIGGIEEGDDWNEEGGWSSDETPSNLATKGNSLQSNSNKVVLEGKESTTKDSHASKIEQDSWDSFLS